MDFVAEWTTQFLPLLDSDSARFSQDAWRVAPGRGRGASTRTKPLYRRMVAPDEEHVAASLAYQGVLCSWHPRAPLETILAPVLPSWYQPVVPPRGWVLPQGGNPARMESIQLLERQGEMPRSWVVALLGFGATGLLILFCVPEGVLAGWVKDLAATLIATLIGVFAGIHLERRYSRREEIDNAKEDLRLVRRELEANLEVSKTIAGEELDKLAVIPAFFGLKDFLWTVVSRGGRVLADGDLGPLSAVAQAYEKIRGLRGIATLFYSGAPGVLLENGAGFTETYDKLRKDLARDAVEAIESCLGRLPEGT